MIPVRLCNTSFSFLLSFVFFSFFNITKHYIVLSEYITCSVTWAFIFSIPSFIIKRWKKRTSFVDSNINVVLERKCIFTVYV